VKDGLMVGDAIHTEGADLGERVTIIDPVDGLRRKELDGKGEDLLKPVMKNGTRIWNESLDEARKRCEISLSQLHPGIRRLENPHVYPAGLEQGLWERREEMLRRQ